MQDFIRILLNESTSRPSFLANSVTPVKKKSENKKLMYVHKVEILLSSD